MNTVTININGMEYNLKGEESSEYLNSVAIEVDKKLREIFSCNQSLTLGSASVLCAINFCDQLKKQKIKCDELSIENEKLNLKLDSLVSDNKELKDRVLHMEMQIQELEIKNGKLEEEVEAYNILLKEDGKDIFDNSNEICELENEIEILRDTLKKITQEKSIIEKEYNDFKERKLKI